MDGAYPALRHDDVQAARFCFEEDEVARIVIDPHGAMLWRSRAAAMLLAGPSPLVDRGGKIGGADRRSQMFLLDRIADALGGEEICQFIDTDQEHRYLLRMRVVDDPTGQFLVVVIKDFDVPAHVPRLERLFGLSAMEARILEEIISGNSAERIADQKGVSILTVRTHIKHIHAKMGVRSKEEILATVVKIFA